MEWSGHPVRRPLVGVLAALAVAIGLVACSPNAPASAPSTPGTPAAGTPAALQTPATSVATEPPPTPSAAPTPSPAPTSSPAPTAAPATPAPTRKPTPAVTTAPRATATPRPTPRPTPAPTATPAPTSSPVVAAGIVDFAFTPATLTVARGSSIRWTNGDGVPHNVTADGGSFASGTLATNATFTRAFPTAGTFTYLCTIHPSMTGTVIVTP